MQLTSSLTVKMESLDSSVAIIEKIIDLKQVLQVEEVFHATQ